MRRTGDDPTTSITTTYSDDERAFLMAVDRYRRERKRPFPTAVEFLKIAIEQGYRKPGEDEAG